MIAIITIAARVSAEDAVRAFGGPDLGARARSELCRDNSRVLDIWSRSFVEITLESELCRNDKLYIISPRNKHEFFIIMM